MSKYRNIITDEFIDGDGVHVKRAILPIPGHDVQVVHAETGASFTVKVDDAIEQVHVENVLTWILRKLGGE